ncbi:hypothetical protein F383_09660 [Gossypium arboreum]|uniref:Uncharacterized protein n=1 Tax=Gossypium arboreum TaxID=29729 RepID=A0A0B0P4P4_GOSAR|nr:hypothetical protein F383_09660 [Gossypium arboreum]
MVVHIFILLFLWVYHPFTEYAHLIIYNRQINFHIDILYNFT